MHKQAAHAAWHVIGGKRKYFRSKWEATFAHFLQNLKDVGVIQDWDHEPETFWFEEIRRGVRSYKPDFKVTRPAGDHYWVEVKGYMDAKSKTKLKRFAKYYPDEILIVIDKKWFESRKAKKDFWPEHTFGFMQDRSYKYVYDEVGDYYDPSREKK